MPSKIYSGAVVGIDAKPVEVETEVSYGLRVFEIVGLPDKAIEESKERIGVAIKNSGFPSPRNQPLRVLVNLAPADVKKEGALYDLPIAIGFLVASKKLAFDAAGKMILGELSLDGSLRPIKGALAFALLAKELGYEEILLPQENAEEAAIVNMQDEAPLKVVGLATLKDAVQYLQGTLDIAATEAPEMSEQTYNSSLLPFIKGQEFAKRALEIAAAGRHNLFLFGPPGTGKSLLAKAIAELLPSLAFPEALEVTKIYSVAGMLPSNQPLVWQAPFRSPHHTSSEVALIGGGNPPRAGEITLAHRGVLFLDEFPEFHRDALESLRQPIEEGEIALLRSKYRSTLPARFMVVAAANPCPCGYYRNPEKDCICSPSSVQKYKRKLSGPLMDRMDLFVEVPQMHYDDLTQEDPEAAKEAEDIQTRVRDARETQRRRFGKERTNADMTLEEIKKHCAVNAQSEQILKQYVDSGKLSARGYHRILKLARTIADLATSEHIAFEHVAEALSYRMREE